MITADTGRTTPSRRWRSAHLFITLVTLLSFVAGGIALVPDSVRADASEVNATTDRLKLRAAPALNAEILDVIPAGAEVTVTGEADNGFYPVNYAGQDGYAYGAYITGVPAVEGPATTGGEQGEVNVADGPVNFRTGPSTDDSIISVIPDGALVALNGDSANGFLGIIYTDRSGWADAASILGTSGDAPSEPVAPAEPAEPAAPNEVPVGDTVTGSATVVGGSLNLRSGPGTTYDVILTLPDGATVELRGDVQDGFFPLSYNGTTGWASAQWLDTESDDEAPTEVPATEAPMTEEPATEAPATEAPATEAPATEVPATEPPVDGSDGYTEDEIIQIIYAAADQYNQPREDMLRVARCESVLDPNAVNSSSDASGLFQFLPSTWARTPYADQDVFDPVANAEAAAWMWAQGNRGEWTCQ
jgi:uncharacterized protein YraI